MDEIDQDPSLTGHGLLIHQASELLGVPAPTLRSWERRYGLPTTVRSLGGHRRYQRAEMVQLRLMRDEIAMGRPALDAARRVRAFLDADNVARGWVDRLLAGSQAMEAAAVRSALDGALDEFGLATTLDLVLMAGMRQVGSWWENGRCDVGLEHFTTEVVRGWLAQQMSLAPPPRSQRWVLLAVGPRDMHTVGLEALAALLTHHGTGCRVLGPRTPIRVLVTAAVATSAAAVVVVSHVSTQRRSALDSLAAATHTGLPTFYAGNAFVSPASRRNVPGAYLGETIAGAAELVRVTLAAADTV